MGFLSVLFGGKQLSEEEERQEQQQKKFDLLKYDGVKAMKIGQSDYAVRCFNEALKLQDDLEVHDYLSQVFLRQGELDAAMKELRVLGDAEPENAQIQLRMAQVAYMQEDYATMAAACQQAMVLEPENPDPCFLTAQAMKGQQNLVGAIAMLTKALTLKDDYAEVYLLRAQTLLAMGDTTSADADADWLLEHVGDHEDVLLLKARIEAAKGNSEEAIHTYDKVVEVNPFCIEAFRERGQLKFDAGDKAGAEQDMQTVLELDPQQLADVSGEYSAEGIEQRVKQAYSAVNPLGL
ncbi:MAG: tetratricopeptide repeat protein [Prevotella sp.]|nr:tetratricopeptide repeat protein [Prevotella sp.]